MLVLLGLLSAGKEEEQIHHTEYSPGSTMETFSNSLEFSFCQCIFCGKIFHILCRTTPGLLEGELQN